MSNYEYDKLYDELQELEEKLGTRMANSPTVNVGYEVLSELPKERHERPMLSLDKTKDVERLKEFLGGQKALISWKLDGLTVVLTYQNGELAKAVTRGNGVIGEVITNNSKVFKNVPLKIPYQGELVLRGEAVISYKDFEKIKEEIEYRKIVVRKKELEAVKEARAQGDLSENFEYKAAKQEKNRNESRIRFLEKFCIPAPVIGGLLFAIFTCVCYTTGIIEFSFDDTLREVCMVFFFTSVGFQAENPYWYSSHLLSH